MRVCLILHGHLRTFKKTIESLNKNITDFDNIDIFIHTWNTIDRLTPSYYKECNNNSDIITADMIKTIYKPKDFSIETQMLKDPNITCPYNKISLEGHKYYFESFYKANELKNNYEKKNNFKYDIVIKSRPDVLFKTPLDLTKLNKNTTYLLGNPINNNYEEFVNFGCSGANATQIGLMKGYSKIILLGCDCSYVNKIEEEKDLGVGKQIEIVKEIKTNLNYWFDGYQNVGDRLNTPDAEIWHMPAWENVKKYCPQNTKIINCSEISKINFFDKLSFVKGLNKLYYENIIKEYTFIIKTFNRYKDLLRLLNSIKKYYNGVKIIIFDDSIKKENINNLFDYENLKIIDNYVNVGASSGRNIMIENVKTPCFLLLDDDFFLDDNCNLGISYEIAKQGFDIIGGEVYDVGPTCNKSNQARDFFGLLEKKEDKLYLYKSKNKGHFNHYPLYDFILNFFVGKTESFRNNKWDDKLKLGEHLDFFIRFDKSLKITYSNNFQIKHYQDETSNIEYNEYRNTVHKYLKIFKENHNINEIYTIKNNIKLKIKG